MAGSETETVHEIPGTTTQRLYYTNSLLTTFDGTVVAVDVLDVTEGAKARVALDRTAFYPTSGGQPHDTGELGGVRVVDVTAENGIVWHWLQEAPAWQAGETVEGRIDWARRFDHMQQHSAQHLLSQVFARLFEAETLSVHFGAEESTLDLDSPSLDTAQIEAAEALAAETVFAALPILSYTVHESQVGTIPLRRAPAVQGDIRIVEIEGFDWSACGGTHCRTTAEAGPIKVIRSERRRGGVRLTFLAGGRAVADYRRKHALLGEAAALFSSDMAQVPALIERQMALGKDLARRLEEATGRLLAADAAELLAAAQPLGTRDDAQGPLLVCSLRADLDATALRTLAGHIVAQAAMPPGVVAVLGSTQAERLLLTFARSANLPQHMGNLLRETLQQAGGNGGGRPDYAQGGGVAADRVDELLAYAVARMRATG